MILSSVGRLTVNRYLGFAIGHGIGPPEGNELEAAVGLENIGKEVHHTEDEQPPIRCSSKQEVSDDSDIECKLSSLGVEDDAERDSANGDLHDVEPKFNYGNIGDKVGEACACWLTRWGADMLPYEENMTPESRLTSEPSAFLRSSAAGPSMGQGTKAAAQRSSLLEVTSPTLWGRQGLPAPWVRAVISSDDFFIKSEWERYKFSKRVVELRRRGGLDPHEEKEWEQLFQRGIYYLHMVRVPILHVKSILIAFYAVA